MFKCQRGECRLVSLWRHHIAAVVTRGVGSLNFTGVDWLTNFPPFCHSAIITFTCNHNQEASFSLLNSDLCPTGGFPNLITKRRFEAPKIGRKLINNENWIVRHTQKSRLKGKARNEGCDLSWSRSRFPERESNKGLPLPDLRTHST